MSEKVRWNHPNEEQKEEKKDEHWCFGYDLFPIFLFSFSFLSPSPPLIDFSLHLYYIDLSPLFSPFLFLIHLLLVDWTSFGSCFTYLPCLFARFTPIIVFCLIGWLID